ncbi:MAG: N-acetylmuramoyl-L-alanine amidase [Verrucomicrobiae bacterium]|nr:N-acetylmuramoyl-L-alanine amidase [Verrucomicrobiae bacterium]
MRRFVLLVSLLLAAGTVRAAELPEPIAKPDWPSLEKYQRSITRREFCRLLDKVYNPSKTVRRYLNLADEFVEFFTDEEKAQLDFTLHFAASDAKVRPVHRTFKTVSELKELRNPPEAPLRGVRLVLDPGHIGGKWADIEERSVVWGNHPRIREGDMNLLVAKLARPRLAAAGAEVHMTHETPDPVTPLRPKDFLEETRRAVLAEKGLAEDDPASRRESLRRIILWRAELAFYRKAEISQRAANIRAWYPPDFNICNHFNATEYSGSGQMVNDNRMVFLINGCYGPDEMDNPLTRFFMFSKLLEQSLSIEMAVGDAITRHMLKIANLPPAKYGREKYQCRVNDNPYLYARNLAVSRQYPGPCLILEPFYMNTSWTAERLAAGDYDGVRQLSCGPHRSLLREYAEALAGALIEAYAQWTVAPKSSQPAPDTGAAAAAVR